MNKCTGMAHRISSYFGTHGTALSQTSVYEVFIFSKSFNFKYTYTHTTKHFLTCKYTSHMYVCTHTHTHIYPITPSHMHPHSPTHPHACMHAHTHCARVCVGGWGVCVCVCVCRCARTPTPTPTFCLAACSATMSLRSSFCSLVSFSCSSYLQRRQWNGMETQTVHSLELHREDTYIHIYYIYTPYRVLYVTLKD